MTLEEEEEMSYGGSDTQAIGRSKDALAREEEHGSDPGMPMEGSIKLDFFGVADLKEVELEGVKRRPSEEEKEKERIGVIT